MDPGEREFLYDEIIGLTVVTNGGQTLGVVSAVMKTGANDVYYVEQDGQEILIPALKTVIKEINLEDGLMTIDPLPGLIENQILKVKTREPKTRNKRQKT